MKLEDYFKEWYKIIDTVELHKVIGQLKKVDLSTLCPHPNNIFKAFELCPYNELKVVFLGYDPYPQKDVATGIMFGNKSSTPEDKISPSLNILKEACINFEIPHNRINFDVTLESWCKQGVLLLNSALTCEVGKTGCHTMLWRPFISNFLKKLSYKESNLIYVLLGKNAQTFLPYINSKYNYIFKVDHPSYYARTNTSMPSKLFIDINKILKDNYGTSIKWFQEY